MAKLYLHDGPCDGIWIDPGALSAAPASFTCKGKLYVLAGASGYYLPGSPELVGTSAGPLAPKAHRGWHDLQQTFNRSLPLALTHSQKLRRAAARKLARGRR